MLSLFFSVFAWIAVHHGPANWAGLISFCQEATISVCKIVVCKQINDQLSSEGDLSTSTIDLLLSLFFSVLSKKQFIMALQIETESVCIKRLVCKQIDDQLQRTIFISVL